MKNFETKNFETKQIKSMVRKFQRDEVIREKIIMISRDIIKESKQIIYNIHRMQRCERNDIQKIIRNIKIKKSKLDKLIKKYNLETGIANTAMQEYTEALCFYDFINHRKIKTASQLGVTIDDYIAGLCDLTGELGRYCVIKSIKKDISEVSRAKNLIEDIFGVILMFDFRNGELRKKSDSVKWNLKKAEEVLFELIKER